jgi:hypothetical protein
MQCSGAAETVEDEGDSFREIGSSTMGCRTRSGGRLQANKQSSQHSSSYRAADTRTQYIPLPRSLYRLY